MGLGSQDRPVQMFNNSPRGVSGQCRMACLVSGTCPEDSEQTKIIWVVGEGREAARV